MEKLFTIISAAILPFSCKKTEEESGTAVGKCEPVSKIQIFIKRYATIYKISLIKTLAFPIIALIITSCGDGKSTKYSRDNNLPYKIDVEKYYDNVAPVPLSAIGKELVYVPLETRPDLVLGNIGGIAVYDSLIFVNDSKQLYLFDINGKFIRRIGSIGRGPGEYNLPHFAVDGYNGLVYVGGADKINCFDFFGNDMGSFEPDFYVLNFIVKDYSTILFQKVSYSSQWDQPDSTTGWYLINGKGELVSKIGSSYGYNFTSVPFLTPASMYSYDNYIHFKELFSDTLFCFMGDIKEPYAIFDYGKYWQDVSTLQLEDLGNENSTKILKIDHILEDDAYLFFTLCFSLSKNNLCFYDKKTGELSLLDGDGFINDLDGGANFWPKFVYNDSILVDYCNSFELLAHLKNVNPSEQSKIYGTKYSQLEELATSLDDMSNPVLVILKP